MEGERGYLRRGKWRGGERFVSGMGECACEEIGVPSMLRFIHRVVSLVMILTTLDLSWLFLL